MRRRAFARSHRRSAALDFIHRMAERHGSVAYLPALAAFSRRLSDLWSDFRTFDAGRLWRDGAPDTESDSRGNPAPAREGRATALFVLLQQSEKPTAATQCAAPHHVHHQTFLAAGGW